MLIATMQVAQRVLGWQLTIGQAFALWLLIMVIFAVVSYFYLRRRK